MIKSLRAANERAETEPPPRRKAGRKIESIRWTLEMAASEFGRDNATVKRAVKAAGKLPGSDARFSTADIAAALFGSHDEERRLLTIQRREEIAIDTEIKRKTRIPLDVCEALDAEVLGNVVAMLKAHEGKMLSQTLIRDMLAEMRRIGEALRKWTPSA